MSEKKVLQEANRWYQQSLDDLEAASGLLAIQKYAQACFYAQQASEKALKAVFIKLAAQARRSLLYLLANY